MSCAADPRVPPATLPEPRLYALVPCAGVGARAGQGGPKQYARLAGRPLVAHTLEALHRVPELAGVLVVLAPGDDRFAAELPQYAGWVAHVGGDTRAASVAAGLEELVRRGARAEDWVLVHDAARCLVRPEWVRTLIAACRDDEVGGLLALPLADTLKEDVAGRSAVTLERRGKWQAQTPQMFRLGLLRRALAQARGEVTDEASAVEQLGLRPRLVPGSLENFKLTYPQDFELAERLLRSRP